MSGAGHSGGAGGRSLPGGGPVVLRVGDKGLGRQRGGKASQHQCHHWALVVTIRRGSKASISSDLPPIPRAARTHSFLCLTSTLKSFLSFFLLSLSFLYFFLPIQFSCETVRDCLILTVLFVSF